MASGRLAGLEGTGTPQILYRAGGYQTASTVVTATNRSGNGTAFWLALRDYDQALTLDAGTYKFHEGNVISTYSLVLDQTISRTAILPGTQLSDATGEKSFRYHDVVPAGTQTINVKAVALTPINFEAQTGGSFAVGETITNGTASAYIYEVSNIDDINTPENESILYLGDITGGTFSEGDTISVVASGAAATISAGGIGTAINHLVYEDPNHATSQVYQTFQIANTLSLYSDRVYQFDLSDSSLTGLDLKLSTTLNGVWGPDGYAPGDPLDTTDAGSEFTTGVTFNGTIGSAGAYLEIDIPLAGLATGSTLFMYDNTVATAANYEYGSLLSLATGNGGFGVSDQFTYNAIYIYDLSGGDLVINDTFTSGATTYAVTAVNDGPYGYVRRWVPAGPTLHVIAGYNSPVWAGTESFLDSPNEVGGNRTMATAVSANSVVATTNDQMLVNQFTFSQTGQYEKISSLVVGHGNSLVAWCQNGNVTFTVNGFTDSTTDWAPSNYQFSDLAGGAAAGGDGGGDAGDGVAGG